MTSTAFDSALFFCRALTLLIGISISLGALADSDSAFDIGMKEVDFDDALEHSLEKEFSQFDQRTDSQFEGFSAANEAVFSKEFVNQWQQFTRAFIDPAPAQPKPAVQPEQQPEQQPKQQHSPATQTQNKTLTLADDAVSTATLTPSSRQTEQAQIKTPTLRQQLSTQPPGLFFGHPVPPPPMAAAFDMSASPLGLEPISGTSPSALLSFRQAALGQTRFVELIHYFAFLRQRIEADSYASLLLATELCRQQYADPNSQIACSWLLNQSQGFDVRLGLKQNTLLLLVASDQQWFENPFFSLAGRRYYVINKHDFEQAGDAPTNLQSNRHADATKLASISLSKGLLPAGKRLLTRHKFGHDFRIDIDHVAYLFQLPQVDISLYLHDDIPAYLAEQLAPQFPPSNAHATESALKVQRTLQKLPYQIDEEQFGFEKPLTLSELLFFDYSDCEDRVYALAAIGRHFYQLRVGALRYPGHLSAAVMADGVWREADPTYLGAGLDMRQPTFAGVEPERFY